MLKSPCCNATVKRGFKIAQQYHKFYCTKCMKWCEPKEE